MGSVPELRFIIMYINGIFCSCEAMAYTTGQYTHQVQSGHGSGNIQISGMCADYNADLLNDSLYKNIPFKGDGSVTLNVENGHGITTRHYSPKSATASGKDNRFG